MPQGSKNAYLGQHDGFMMYSIGRQKCSGFSADFCGLYGGWQRENLDLMGFPSLEMCEDGFQTDSQSCDNYRYSTARLDQQWPQTLLSGLSITAYPACMRGNTRSPEEKDFL